MNDNLPINPEYQNDEISISEWLNLLLDNWKLIAIATFLCLVAGGTYLITIVPTYRASSLLQVTSSNTSPAENILSMAGVSEESPSETEVEILRSHSNIVETARKLKLNISRPIRKFSLNLQVTLFQRSPVDSNLKELRKSIDDLKIADWRESNIVASFRTETNTLIATIDGKTTRLHRGDFYRNKGISFHLNSIPELNATETDIHLIPDDRLYHDIIDHLAVHTVGGRKQTSLVEMNFTYPDRYIARNFLNALMNTYLEFSLSWKTRQASKSSQFIEQQMHHIGTSLEKTESEIQHFLEDSGAMLLPTQAEALISKGSNLDLELRKLRMQESLMKKISFQLRQANQLNENLSLSGEFLFDDPLMARAMAQLNDLQLKKQTLMADFKPRHPQIVLIDKELRQLHEQIGHYVKSSIKQINSKRRSINESLESIQDDLAEFPQKERTLATLRRNQEVGQQLYTFLLTKLEESRILKASTTVDKRIIDLASTPYAKSSPRRATSILIATLLGLLGGIALVMIRQSVNQKVNDEDEAKKLTKMPVFGVVPNMKHLGYKTSGAPLVQQIWSAPKGPAAEAFRTLRTNLEFSQTDEQSVRVIQISSTEPSEGKSSVISNLAASLSKAGQRVLLADLDLRKPTQQKIWQLPLSPGMSDYLSGQNALEIHRHAQLDVDVVTAGYEPPETQRLLSSNKMKELIEKWRSEYDYVLLDSSPFLVADSLVISKFTDMLIFVVRPGVCHKAALQTAVSACDKMKIIKGLVINGSLSRKGGYYHYYRGSYYGSKTTDTQES